MYTGIIEDLGAVEALNRTDGGAVLTVRTALPTARMKIGDSLSVNGACLTVTAKGRGTIRMDISAETLRRTVLGELKPGDPVNLERCLTLGKLLNGHLVAGHVDGVGRIAAVRPEGGSKLFTFEVAPSEARYLAEKGSIAIDGVSLTVFSVRARRFKCSLIPHTLKATTLGCKGPGDRVNVESDLMAKYVERALAACGGFAAAADRAGRPG